MKGGGGDFLSGKTLAAPNFVYTTAHSISCYLEENKGNVNLHVHLKFVINKGKKDRNSTNYPSLLCFMLNFLEKVIRK